MYDNTVGDLGTTLARDTDDQGIQKDKYSGSEYQSVPEQRCRVCQAAANQSPIVWFTSYRRQIIQCTNCDQSWAGATCLGIFSRYDGQSYNYVSECISHPKCDHYINCG